VSHLTEVAELVARATAGTDTDLIVAAVLHDTVEDTDATLKELLDTFGQHVADLVAEVTDDKSLPKATRKALQIEHATHASPGAKTIKLADKTANLRALAVSPPANWSSERRAEYVAWAGQVVAVCRGISPWLEGEFDTAACAARSVRSEVPGMTDIWPHTARDDERNAYFEAGHAVVAWLEGLEIVRISIDGEGDASPWIEICEPELNLPYVTASDGGHKAHLSVIRGLLAGRAASLREGFGRCGEEFDLTRPVIGDDDTVWRAIALAGSIARDGPAIVPVMWREVAQTVNTPKVWAAVQAVAQALLRDRELAGCEVGAIARHAMRHR